MSNRNCFVSPLSDFFILPIDIYMINLSGTHYDAKISQYQVKTLNCKLIKPYNFMSKKNDPCFALCEEILDI